MSLCNPPSNPPSNPPNDSPGTPLTYAQAGVDVAAAEAAVEALRPLARSTYRPEVLSDIGAFAAVTALPTGYDEPVLVTANDGAGTKPMIASALKRFDTIGIDVVAMCVDDVATLGAEPLLFQDQITMGSVNPEIVTQLVSGMADGCRTAGCALTGGEIAEHPDEMAPDALDVCGFAIGVAERSRLPKPLTTAPALLIGLASPGLRCNGLSLARRALLGNPTSPDGKTTSPSGKATSPPGKTQPGADQVKLQVERLAEPAWSGADHSLGDELLLPSEIYAPAVREMFAECEALAAAHITGGGLAANLARVLSPQVDAVIARGSWPRPRIFCEIQEAGPVTEAEMEAVFNLGVGMLVAVPGDRSASPTISPSATPTAGSPAAQAIAVAQKHGHDAWVVGEIIAGTGQVRLIDRD